MATVPVRHIAGLTALAMLAFAGNSLLCRIALQGAHMDAACFTALRLTAGVIVLAGFAVAQGGAQLLRAGTWLSAAALFTYAAGFPLAYVTLPTGTGALLLFGAVQVTTIGAGLWRGERLRPLAWAAFALAMAGLLGLLAPGVQAAPTVGAALMGCAGIALMAIQSAHERPDAIGLLCGLLSGAVTSGLGYAAWYTALPNLRVTTAANIQLSVPVIAAVGGFVILREPISIRVVLAAIAILGGISIFLVINWRLPPSRPPVTRMR